jgi:prostaglandin-H2 D-isomerase / glutathione transferase
MVASTPKLKLTYFPLKARAESIRLALAISDVPFEDVRVPFSEFPALKPTLPFKQLPIMEIDGKVHAQSRALLRYVGKLTNMYPTDPLEALKVDAVIEALADMANAISKTMQEVCNH